MIFQAFDLGLLMNPPALRTQVAILDPSVFDMGDNHWNSSDFYPVSLPNKSLV